MFRVLLTPALLVCLILLLWLRRPTAATPPAVAPQTIDNPDWQEPYPTGAVML